MTDPEEDAPPSLARVDEILLQVLSGKWSGQTSRTPLAAMQDMVKQAHEELVAYERARQRIMLDAVTADMAGLDITGVPGGQTYRAMALRLAAVIDKRGDDDGPSVTAKLAAELTKVMAALTRKGGGDGDDGYGSFEDDISTPSRP